MIKKTSSRLTDERNNFKPFNYPWAYDAWLKHEQSHWLHTEVPMAEDVKDWKKKLTDQENNFLPTFSDSSLKVTLMLPVVMFVITCLIFHNQKYE